MLTEYEFAFTAEDHVRVRIVTERGRGVVSFAVQYEITIGGRTAPVVRYDSAHGQPHRDVLDPLGHTISKDWLPHWDMGEALDHALADLRANWRDYRAEFEEGAA